MPEYLWIIIVAVLALVVLGFVVVSRRRRPAIPAQRPPLPPEPAEGETPPAQPADTAAPPAAPTAVLERPEVATTRWGRLKSRLARSGALGQSLLAILSRGDLSDADWDDLEDTLLLADVGVGPTTELLDGLKTALKVEGSTDPAVARRILRDQLIKVLDPSLDRSLHTDGEDGNPGVVLVIGVNGTGKTTTVGKLARVLVADGKTVLLGAADTFRAAAAEQLSTWGGRVGVETVRSDREGADPASVAFDAVKTGKAQDVDTVLIDTAGRLHTKTGLMDELGKIARVVSKEAPITETLLVLDATTGQNGMTQARIFGAAAGVTGIVLTKLDGTAKGGIVVAVQRELGVPVKLVGLGEGMDDLAPFVPEEFVDGLLGAEASS